MPHNLNLLYLINHHTNLKLLFTTYDRLYNGYCDLINNINTSTNYIDNNIGINGPITFGEFGTSDDDLANKYVVNNDNYPYI